MFHYPDISPASTGSAGGSASHHSSLDIVSKQQSEPGLVLIFKIMFENHFCRSYNNVMFLGEFQFQRASQNLLTGHLTLGLDAKNASLFSTFNRSNSFGFLFLFLSSASSNELLNRNLFSTQLLQNQIFLAA